MNKTGFLFLLLIYFNLGYFPASAQELKVNGQFFTLDDKPFDMWGVRVASATQINEYTKSLIKNLNDYKSEGINTLSIYLQGSSGGYSDPFYDEGRNIKKGHLRRLKNIIEECAQRDMVVIVGIFYQRTVRNESNLKTEAEIREAVRTVTQLLKPYNNIIINIANEQNSGYYKGFEAFNFNDPQNIIGLCEVAKKTDPNRIVGAGGYHDSSNVVIGKSEFVDVLLFDTFSGDIEKGHDSGWHYNFFKAEGVPEKPIVNVEIFGGWTKKFLPQGVYTEKGKEIHLKEIEAAKKQPGLFVHFHSNPWFQAADQGMKNRYDLGGMGTSDDPGVRWYFQKIKEGN
jgi:hypothetical protein